MPATKDDVDLRTRVVEVSLELFAENGFAGTSVRDIAERLGVTKAALYYHFASKDAILQAIAQPMVASLTAMVNQPRTTSPEEIFNDIIDIAIQHGSLLSLMMTDPSAKHAMIDAAHAEQLDIHAINDRIAKRLAGTSRSQTANVSAFCALGAVQAGTVAAITRVPDAAHALRPAVRAQIVAAALAALHATANSAATPQNHQTAED